MLSWATRILTGISPHQSPEAASGAPISHGDSSWHDPAHPPNTLMALNLVNSDPPANSMTEVEEKGYSSQVETILAADNVRDTIPEATSRATNGPGSNPAIQLPTGIQEKVIMHIN